jgi:hypothetical protein
MATSINAPVRWTNTEAQKVNTNIWKKWMTFTDSQEPNQAMWFTVSLIFQGVFFLPLPAVLTYYFYAPVYLLIVTLSMFFINLISGMGGSGIRVTLTLFALSVLVHMAMMTAYML